MPYTLSMALLWVALAVLLGIAVGWLMRSVVAKRQIERARSNHLDHIELERLRARVAELESPASEHDRLRSDPAARLAPVEAAPVTPAIATAPIGDATGEPARDPADLASAEAVLGTRIERDDLTVIDGIGPKIAELCAGIGIQTWNDLAQTEVSLLRTMLDDAGPRFKSHDPTTWPEQAAALAAGRWGEFGALTARPDGGRAEDGTTIG